ncbi:uncharacterized protein K489DRAFT_413764 [Dissoconium aciculare CBS 342.82]|jgi:hypothetical protein|uniref:F-box domain-containing protein n=1 Tax=Dissoconium aciculare CBS 342.82 TaxID=1314786 RepID=A0A6J3LT69_9PEZI|nr:uncharacterized protein K489DRAFT_413764 [Dissoconium aciculare CBS 342.82]KAF1818479.1 hypothetical protein K489DRAFT_413764 [Dissoconium aciculare CBS 342.82]
MSFAQLAPELLSIVVSCLKLSGERLSKYATISSAFRGSVEAALFADLKLSSQELDDFERIIIPRSPGRRDIIGDLTLTIILPTYTEAQCAFFERELDQRINNEAFTSSMLRLFSMLQHFRSRPLKLRLYYIYSPMDLPYRADPTKARWDADMGARKDLLTHRYEYSYLHFLEERLEDLPIISQITEWHVSADTPRLLAPAAAAMLTSKFPSIRNIDWDLNDQNRRSPHARSRLRQEFSRHLANLRTPNVSNFKLGYMHYSPPNEGFRNANLLCDSLDPFSTSLRKYLQTCNLVRIVLSGPICLSGDFFWVAGEQKGLAESWPLLKTFDLDLSIVRPDGGWYLQRDPGASPGSDEEGLPDDDRSLSDRSDDDFSLHGSDLSFGTGERSPDVYNHSHEDRYAGREPCRTFRSYPTSELEELFEAAAHAARHMTHAESFAAGFSNIRRDGDLYDLDFQFFTSGHGGFGQLPAHEIRYNRLLWRVPRGWRMGPQLERLWSIVIGEHGVVEYEEW